MEIITSSCAIAGKNKSESQQFQCVNGAICRPPVGKATGGCGFLLILLILMLLISRTAVFRICKWQIQLHHVLFFQVYNQTRKIYLLRWVYDFIWSVSLDLTPPENKILPWSVCFQRIDKMDQITLIWISGLRCVKCGQRPDTRVFGVEDRSPPLQRLTAQI